MKTTRFVWIILLSVAAVLSALAQNSPQEQQQPLTPLKKVLNPNGTLNPTNGFSGSLDPAGWQMVTEENGQPRFVRTSAISATAASESGDENWDDRFALGVDTNVYAIAVSGSDIYVGFFGKGTQVSAGYIAKWNGYSWSTLGGGVDNHVFAIAVSGSDVYVGGGFTNASGVSANYIAKWDGSSWSALGSGVSGQYGGFVDSVAVSGTDVYAGGCFTNAGGVSANNIAKWDGSNWSALAGGVSAAGRVLAIAVSGTDVYVGGIFTNAGGVSAKNIARWDGSSWSALGGGVDGFIFAIAVNGSDLYVGGTCTNAYGVPVPKIVKWNGSSWSELGTGVSGGFYFHDYYPTVYAMAVSGADVYVGGNFTYAGGVSANGIAKWDGSSWSAVGGGMNEAVRAIAASCGHIYVGGDFLTAGVLTANHIAKWDGTGWGVFGSGVGGPVGGVAVSGSDVYVGGSFRNAGGVSVFNVAKWDGSSWSALGIGVNDAVNAIAVNGTDVYVGGYFTTAGGVNAEHVAKWDGSTWSALGSGVAGQIHAIAISGNDVYVGGSFTNAGGVSANYIAKWDGSSWSALGGGVAGPGYYYYPAVYAVAVNGANVYVGGHFTSAGGVSANNIAKWDGSGWSALSGAYQCDEVWAAAVSGSDLYISACQYGLWWCIAKWDGGSWSHIGGGGGGGGGTIAVSDGNVYVNCFETVGLCWTSGEIPSYNFAIWHGMGFCAFSLVPAGQCFDLSVGDGVVAVTTETNCNWTAASNHPSWLHILSGASGTGDGSVNYRVDANTGAARIGTLTIGDRVFTVTQLGESCTYSVNPLSVSVGPAATNGTIGVTAQDGCAWIAASDDSWLTVTAGGSGAGSGTVSYSVAANSSTTAHNGTLTIAGQTFTVTQAATGEGCTFTLKPTSINLPAKGGSKTVKLKAQGTDCTWTAVSNDSFITITAGSSGTGNGTVRYSVPGNTNTVPLTGTMTIAGQTFTVNQAAGGCTFSLSPKSGKFKAAGGSKTVKVKPNFSDCAWTAVSNDSFITITGGASGVGKGTVSYSVAVNTNTAPVTGTMTVAGQTFTVTESGAQ